MLRKGVLNVFATSNTWQRDALNLFLASISSFSFSSVDIFFAGVGLTFFAGVSKVCVGGD